jgi:pimeloyl-ACP methyl ester carboxylesterase
MVAQIRLSISSGNFSERSDLQRAALKNAGWSARLSEIRSDTLIIHGAKDLVIDQEGALLLRDSVPHARLEIIPEAGHLLLAEAPRELYRLALDFLSK